MKNKDYSLISDRLIALQNSDLRLRSELLKKQVLSNEYHNVLERIHLENAHVLAEVFDEIGYPTQEKVGKEAAEAAWHILQHAISSPTIMKKGLRLLA